MKSLVICCDGTWKSSDDRHVSNIERIARTVATADAWNNPQLTYYTNGVGTGVTWFERAVGGAFGWGLDRALLGAYRFLALNYEPGDEVYVFGFSRGAYTARSLVGMISYLGLLTPEAVADGWLRDAIEAYRARPEGSLPEVLHGTRVARYRGAVHRSQPRIAFLGVFDTVGALGVPGIARRRYAFHDVRLGGIVDCARHALAIDERRRVFAPSVWEAGEETDVDVCQVWFEGAHSDIGGGYADHGPADLTLRWMVGEAAARGLAFRWDLFRLAGPAAPLIGHESLIPRYWVHNQIGAATEIVRRLMGPAVSSRIRHGRREIERSGDAGEIRIARPAYNRREMAPVQRRVVATNVARWIAEHDGDVPVEHVPTLAELRLRYPDRRRHGLVGARLEHDDHPERRGMARGAVAGERRIWLVQNTAADDGR